MTGSSRVPGSLYQTNFEEPHGSGVEVFAYDGRLRAKAGSRAIEDRGEAATLRDGAVGAPNREAGELTPKEIAAREAVRSYVAVGAEKSSHSERTVCT